MEAAALRIFTLSFLLSLLSGNSLAPAQVGKFPPSCNRIECPSYELVNSGNGYEIRLYNTTVWISTEPIKDASLVKATRTSFSQTINGNVNGKKGNAPETHGTRNGTHGDIGKVDMCVLNPASRNPDWKWGRGGSYRKVDRTEAFIFEWDLIRQASGSNSVLKTRPNRPNHDSLF
ncbi:hypothetical protein F2Q68_00046666 [Brassica cretica]|uniref:Uncharacterized protein n=1 Tax=Brassica cretica TaxID=69181 RepID=A0A8S9LLL9_BRACR|nr:hypothetical protein F2Q68_00046666 [Brassica cretica]